MTGRIRRAPLYKYSLQGRPIEDWPEKPLRTMTWFLESAAGRFAGLRAQTGSSEAKVSDQGRRYEHRTTGARLTSDDKALYLKIDKLSLLKSKKSSILVQSIAVENSILTHRRRDVLNHGLR